MMVGHRWWARYTHISLVVSGWELMRWGAQVTSGVIISHSQEDREKLTWLALHRHVLGDNKLPAGVSGWTQQLSIQLESSGMAPEPSPHVGDLDGILTCTHICTAPSMRGWFPESSMGHKTRASP